jgi:hypothetical protein
MKMGNVGTPFMASAVCVGAHSGAPRGITHSRIGLSISLLVLLLILHPIADATAQEPTPEAPVISAATIANLAPLRQIDYATLTDSVGTALELVNGWFALSPDGSRIAIKSDANQVVLLDDVGRVEQVYTAPLDALPDDLPATFIDGAFSSDGRWFVSAHTLGTDLHLVSVSLEGDGPPVEQVFPQVGYPTRVWISDANEVWLEMVPDFTRADSRPYLLAAWALEPCAAASCPERSQEVVSGPDNDPDSFFRVGRIWQNAAITVTQTFLAKRWNLYTGEVTATGQLTVLPGMAALTPDMRYFAWRDNESTQLRLLDFATGEDRLLAELGGQYIPFLMLSPGAEVIIGVHVAGQPTVSAWRVSDGTRLELGQHRACNRPPDLAMLNMQGNQLVIGCDLGLEIWRIP